MNTKCIAILWIAFSATGLFAQEKMAAGPLQAHPVIMSSATGAEIEMKQLVNELLQCDVIFLGEQHNNDAGHVFQLSIVNELVSSGVDVAISMEQFERDVQGVVDDYLAGRIEEQEFLAHSRPWKNYRKHYRPLIELAREHRLPVLAANVPRKLATSISLGESPTPTLREFLPRKTTAPEDAYWQNFLDTMKGHMGADDEDKIKHFYSAQCIKDDAMAESIADYLARNKHRPKVVVHLCGHFHSDYGLGTAARVVQRMPLRRIAVVTMETYPEDGKPEMETVRDRAHYVFWTIKNKTNSAEPKKETAEIQ